MIPSIAPSRLKIVQHNVLCWNTHKHDITNTYLETDPDVILINAHGLTDNNRIHIHNYNVYQSNKTNTLHDGVAIAIKQQIPHKIHDNYTSEMMSVQIQTSAGDILLATLYTPPRRPNPPVNDFLKIANSHLPAYILADINARHYILGHNNTNVMGTAIATLMNNNKLHHIGPTFKTYLGRHQGTPDIILTNNRAFHNTHIQRGPLTSSDHLPVVLTLSTAPIQIPRRQKRLDLRQADWTNYRYDLQTHEIPDLQNKHIHEIDKEIDKVHISIKNAVKRNIPESTYRTLPSIHKTDRLRQIQTMFTNTIQYINIHGPNDVTTRRIRELQHDLQSEFNKLNIDKWNDITDRLNTYGPKESRKFWQMIESCSGNTRHEDLPYLVDQNGNKLYTDEEKEEAMRRQWIKVFRISDEENQEFDQNFEQEIDNFIDDNLHRVTPNITVNKDNLELTGFVTLEEFYHCLRRFKEKAPGKTGITKNMIVNAPTNIKLTLTEIYNASLASGYFPDTLKTAKMILIPKPNTDRKYITNYRPISLLEITAKILERILNNRLLPFLEENNLLNDRQHGFRPDRGTHTAIATLTELIAHKRTENKQVYLILRDISKAFDKVWTKGLWATILRCSLPGSLETILCNYLHNRQAFIQINTHQGPTFNLLSGVPQGSVISPTLFILYTSSIPPPTPYSEFLMYADDCTQLTWYPSDSKHMMARVTQRAIQQINDHERKWKIKTNTRKFKIIPLAKYSKPPIYINNTQYNYSTEGTMLGMKITTTGYTSHYKDLLRKGRAALSKINRFRQLTTKRKTLLYTALVKSVITYPIIPTHTFTNHHLHRLQAIQNKGLRFIHNNYYPNLHKAKTLHRRSGMTPLNLYLHNRAKVIWDTIIDEPDTITRNIILPSEQNNANFHRWFPSSRKKLRDNPLPRPHYARTRHRN